MIIMLSFTHHHVIPKSSKICGWLNSAQWQYTEILKKASKFVSKKVIALSYLFFFFLRKLTPVRFCAKQPDERGKQIRNEECIFATY